jgi:hypothetical protein
VFWFGVFLGLLAAVSTAVGTTITLIGLLFTLVGGSFLTWYRADALKDHQRAELVGLIGWIGTGCLAGLLGGFGLQFVRDFWVTPVIYQKYQEMHLSPPEAGKPIATTAWVKPPDIGKTFTTQASEADYLSLARELEAEAKTNTRLTDDDKQALSKLAEEVAALLGAFEQLKKKGTRDRLSDRAKQALDKVITTSP